MPVRFENISYPCFLALSLALHLALLPVLWRKPFPAVPVFEPISVSFLPEAKPIESQKTESTAPPPSRRREPVARAKQLKRAPAAIRKPAPPPQPEPQTTAAPSLPELPLRMEKAAQPPVIEAQSEVDQASAMRSSEQAEASIFKDVPDKPITKNDLLPRRRDLIAHHRAIPLNTSDVRYRSYTQMVKQWIESRWEYPDLAKHYGLQGRVVVEFTILQNGHVEFLALVRSSGSKLLDEEAVRAIKAAMPFKPFPRSISESSLRIIAGFIYSDQRLRVSDTQ
jgi:protein TonB